MPLSSHPPSVSLLPAMPAAALLMPSSTTATSMAGMVTAEQGGTRLSTRELLFPRPQRSVQGNRELTAEIRGAQRSLPCGRAALQPRLQSFSKERAENEQWVAAGRALNSPGWGSSACTSLGRSDPTHTIPGELGGDRAAQPELTATAQRHLFV